MDLLTWSLATTLGALVGLITGLIPGLHVNTLTALALPLALAGGPALALFLVAVGTVHTFVSILPAVYLGAPGEDTAVAMLPAHRMLLEGRGPAAVAVSVHASLTAVVLVLLLLLPYRWLLQEPGRLLSWIEQATPWLLLLVVLLLVLSERRRGVQAMLRAMLVSLLAGALGITTRSHTPQGFLPIPGSPLLPLLAGAFGLPALLVALRAPPRLPPQRRSRSQAAPGPVLQGTLAAACTALLPGVTGAAATAMARVGRDDAPPTIVAVLSAVNTAHATFALALLWLIGRARTGLAQATQQLLHPGPWPPGPMPTDLRWLLATVLLAGCLGTVGTRALDRVLAPRIHALPPRLPVLAGLLLMTGITFLLTGPHGLLLFAVAGAVGSVPIVWGVRRVHLTGLLLWPLL